MIKFLLLTVLLTFTVTSIAIAHPGETDSSGAHICQTDCEKWGLSPGDYHIHSVQELAPTPEPEPGPDPEPAAPAPVIIEPAPAPAPAPTPLDEAQSNDAQVQTSDDETKREIVTLEAEVWTYKGTTYGSEEEMKAAKKADVKAKAKKKTEAEKKAKAEQAALERETEKKADVQDKAPVTVVAIALGLVLLGGGGYWLYRRS